MRSRNTLVSALTLLAALPVVYAAPFDTIAQAMGTAWNIVGATFSFEFVHDSPAIRQGILKFLIFILLLRVVQYGSGKAGFDNKTSGIVGFVVAAVTVLFTPNVFLISGIIALLVPIVLVGWLTYLSMAKWKEGIWNLFGIVVMFLNIFLLQFVIDMFDKWMDFEPEYMEPFIMSVLEILLGIVAILFIAKLIQAAFAVGKGDWKFGGGGRDRDGGSGGDSGRRGRDKTRGRDEYEEEDEGEGGGKPKKPRGLDYDNPSRIRILVTTADDNPVPKAKVKLYALDLPIWRRVIRRGNREMLYRQGITGPDGCWPSRPKYIHIGSGPIRIRVDSRLGDANTEHMVPPTEGDDIYEIQVAVSRRGEPSYAFEPHIDKIEVEDDALMLHGRVT